MVILFKQSIKSILLFLYRAVRHNWIIWFRRPIQVW